MTESENHKPFIGGIDAVIPGMSRFSHFAMATTFDVFIVHEDKNYAQQAAEEAFHLTDRLEGEFSRFIENSDISQIGNLAAHQTLRLGLDSFRCLKLCQRICEETDGAFNVTVGSLMNRWFDKDKNLRQPSKEELETARKHTGCGVFKLNEEEFTIEVMADNVQVDLGAVGKGYAVDKMGESLREWEVNVALINAGGSSVLALDGPVKLPGWPVTLSSPDNRILAKVYLKTRALSGSGVQKGRHIINPRTGQPVKDRLGAWVCTKDAATADALSTAFMVMGTKDIERYCERHTDIQAMVLPADTKQVLSYGNWRGLLADGAPDGS
jgi:thiamine biosynthesis lipoprotein